MIRTNILTPALLAVGIAAFSGIAAAANADTFMNGQSYYGQPANSGAPARVVDLATANCVNVKYGETVNFVNGAKTFAWTFDGLSPHAVSLAKIAPPDFGTKPLNIYVEKDPLLRGGR